MNKKLLMTGILFLVALVVSYSMFGTQETFKEQVALDKDAQIAAKFSKYVYDYSQKNNSRKFFKKFSGVPLEGREYVWATLKEIDSLPQPTSVTAPAKGKAKRYVYYSLNDKKYCFTVSLIKKHWQLKSIQEIKE